MKFINYLTAIVLFIGLVSFSGQGRLTIYLHPEDTLTELKVSLHDSLVMFARQQLGVKYKYSGCSPDGFDCSGFVNYVYLNFGYELPRSSYEISKIGHKVDKENYQKGDLIFFKGSNSKSLRVGHVGIIISEPGEELMFIHASVSRGIVITKLSEAEYYRKRFIQINRVIADKNE